MFKCASVFVCREAGLMAEFLWDPSSPLPKSLETSATDPTLAGPLLQAGENKPDFPAAYVEIMKINVQQCSWSKCNNEKDGESPLVSQQ